MSFPLDVLEEGADVDVVECVAVVVDLDAVEEWDAVVPEAVVDDVE